MDHPETKALVTRLHEDRLAIQEQWANGVYTALEQSGTIQLNAKALGAVIAITDVLDYFTIEEENNDE